MTIQWWRSWHGAPIDPKWLLISAKSGVKAGIVSAVAWALMDYASQNNPRGSIAGFDAETYAAFSGFDESDITAVVAAMVNKGMVVDEVFVNWTKRQPQREDESRDRVNQWRATKREEEQCNAVKRNVTRCNTKISADKDTDKDKELKTIATNVAVIIPENLNTPLFLAKWEEWRTYRKEIKKKLTPTTENTQLKKLSGISAQAAIQTIDKSIMNGWIGIFPEISAPAIKPKINDWQEAQRRA